MNKNYNSFLICAHEKIIAYYLNGIEIAIYHKETKQFELSKGTPAQLELIKEMYAFSTGLFVKNS